MFRLALQIGKRPLRLLAGQISRSSCRALQVQRSGAFQLCRAFSTPPPSQNLPVIAKVGKAAKKGAEYGLLLGILGLVSGCGYFIVKELSPGRMSPNRLFNEVLKSIKDHPDVCQRLGYPIKGFGRDMGGSREGRRNFVDFVKGKEDGVPYTRIVFNVEGPHGQGLIYAQTTKKDGPGEYSYIIFHSPRTRETIALVDNREGSEPLQVRQEKVAAELADSGVRLFGSDRCPFTLKQKQELGDAFKYISYVNCDENPAECARVGVSRYPTWMINNKSHEGLKLLDELKTIVKQLRSHVEEHSEVAEEEESDHSNQGFGGLHLRDGDDE